MKMCVKKEIKVTFPLRIIQRVFTEKCVVLKRKFDFFFSSLKILLMAHDHAATCIEVVMQQNFS